MFPRLSSTFFDLQSSCSSVMIAALTGPLFFSYHFFAVPPLLFAFFYLGATSAVYRRRRPPGKGWHTSTKPRGYRQIVLRTNAHQEHFDAVGLSWFRSLPELLRRNTPVHVPRGKDQDLVPPPTPSPNEKQIRLDCLVGFPKSRAPASASESACQRDSWPYAQLASLSTRANGSKH